MKKKLFKKVQQSNINQSTDSTGGGDAFEQEEKRRNVLSKFYI